MQAFAFGLLLLAASPESQSVQVWMQDAFYPVLLGVLVVASLGIPIPEDVPLIAAGVLLKTQPGIASWQGTIAVATLGIMSGDLVLYSMGRWWGPGVVRHRYVRRLLTPERFERLVAYFHRWGAGMVFVGRMFVGIRAAMCLTAGATRYPYWRFFLADFAGALVSVPFFVGLGYVFAYMLPTLKAYMSGAQIVVFALLALGVVIGLVYWRRRRRAKTEATGAALTSSPAGVAEDDLQVPAPPIVEPSGVAEDDEIGVGV